MDKCKWEGCDEEIKHKCNECTNKYCSIHAPGCLMACPSGCDRILCLNHFETKTKIITCIDCK